MNDFPKIALGTWLMGGTKDPDPNNDDEADIQKILLAIKSGVRLIDTAQNYANGKCEELVGLAIKRLDPETISELKILTKHSRLKLNSKQEIRSAIEGSFERLDIDVIDYYLLHAPAENNNTIRLKNYFAVVSRFVDSGRIKNIGVSNFSIELLEYAKKISKYPIRVDQVSLNVFNREAIDSGLLRYCQDNNIAFQAYRVMADLTDKIKTNPVLNKLAKEKGVSNFQIAIAYVLKKGALITVSAASQGHWRDIFSLIDGNPLSSDDVSFIEKNIASEPNPRSSMDEFINMKLG
ncbi:MAG TPA: aldo/keto reductase [Candidatus Saccharibacteria bacterium]|nr:aldo/keto reductase [Candidatus Saccharibacteria bacterium]